jgi:hypothetical protein
VIAGFGPDGLSRGEQADRGSRFGPAVATFRGFPVGSDPSPLVLLDPDARQILLLTLRRDPVGPDSLEPGALDVESRPLRPYEAAGTTAEVLPHVALLERRAIVFLSDGSVFGEVDLAPGERVSSLEGADLVLSTGFVGRFFAPSRPLPTRDVAVGMGSVLFPAHPDTVRLRLRLFRPGREAIERDVTLEPVRASEVLLANLAAAFAVLRPPPLAILSALSPLPSGPDELWWWRDPWLSGGRYPGWLVATLALAALLAWRARRDARERCATLLEVRFWTVAVLLLGPLGLLWMRLVLPRVPVEPVGQGRRAVNLESSPSASAPWPEPAREGIEVFA